MEQYSLAASMMPFSLFCDGLVGRSEDTVVPSFSWSGQTYRVSLANQTCTCLDFVELRHDCPPNHFSRWCKHIITVANRMHYFVGCDAWHKAIAKEGAGGPFAAFLIASPSTQEFLATIGSSRDWINIFVRTAFPGQILPNLTGPIKQFGWSIGEKRWSYGIAPRGARDIRKLLVQIEGMNEGQPLI